MDIQQLLTLGCTQCAVEASSKKRILEFISQLAASQLLAHSQQSISDALSCREKLGSTGIGHGIALPHGRLKGLEQVIGLFVTTAAPVDFDAIDDQPVDIFFAILVPEEQTEGHLQTLATIAGKLNDKKVVKAIRSADNQQALFDAITRTT